MGNKNNISRDVKIKNDVIKKLIDEAMNDKSRPKINFKILGSKTKTEMFKAEATRLPTHLTIEEI